MRGSAAFRTGVAPGGALAPGWVKNELWRNARTVPSLDLRFAEDKSLVDATTGASLVTFTRASSGTFVGSDGVLRTAVTNLLLRSEEFNDASWPRSGTTLPTITTNAGIAPDGNTTADLWTRSITGPNFISQAIGKSASAIQYTFSVFVKQSVGNFCALRCQGTYPNKVDVTFNLNLGTIHTGPTVAGGTFTGPSASITPYPNGWYRLAVTATSDTAVSYQCIVSFNSNGSVIDGTDSVSNSAGLLWGAQLEQSATANEYIPTTNVINSAPRFDHNPTTGESLGLLVEEARTNSIRNNTGVGAVAGTPGTLPTNYSTSGFSGLTREIIGTGIINGVTYIDIKYSGTTTGTFGNLNLEAPTAIAGANGQIWAGSVWLQVIAGSLSGINSIVPSLQQRDSGGAYLADTTNGTVSAVLGTTFQRISRTHTTTNASTAFVQPYLQFSLINSAAIDLTLRIGLPQLEQGAFATSVIPTTTAAATRSADVASISGSNFSSWYNHGEGTLAATASIRGANTVVSTGLSIINGIAKLAETASSSNSRAILFNTGASPNRYTAGQRSAVSIIQLHDNTYETIQFGKYYNLTMSYVNNSTQGLALSVDGRTVLTNATAVDVPVSTRLLIGAGNFGTNPGQNADEYYLNGTIKRLTYWPVRLADPTLQSITQ